MINIGSILPVGTIIHSMLSTAQFATEYGDNWVLADGRSVTGTKYALITGLTALPDMRGRFLRGKGANNPDGDLALGVYTADKYADHNHVQTYSNGASTTETRISNGGSGYTLSSSHIGSSSASVGSSTPSLTTTQKTGSSGSNETAPKSITVNIFIRIN